MLRIVFISAATAFEHLGKTWQHAGLGSRYTYGRPMLYSHATSGLQIADKYLAFLHKSRCLVSRNFGSCVWDSTRQGCMFHGIFSAGVEPLQEGVPKIEVNYHPVLGHESQCIYTS